MLLGKRPRPPIKRTTSMSEITFDLNTATTDEGQRADGVGGFGVGGGGPGPWSTQGLDQNRVLASVSSRNHTRHYSSDLAQTPDFLRACSLCKRRLVPNRDIYMYRGDSAFCSLECREQQMKQDERKDQFFVASKKQVVATATPSAGSRVTTKGETVAAV